MKLYEISDNYTNYMQQYFYSTMLENKEESRKHTRKYIGVLIEINGYKYFAPLSSPKKSDYQNGKIRDSSSIVLRMVKNYSTSPVLLGTIKINNMIPVPDTEIILYDYVAEKDIRYRKLIEDELDWINHNITMIRKVAKGVYKSKMNEKFSRNDKNARYYDSITPFKDAEEKCSLWIKKLLGTQ